MAITTESFNANGVNRIYTVASTILSESHCRVDYYYNSYDHEVTPDKWDVINNSIVFKDAPQDGYVVKITTSTDGEGLSAGPSAISDVAANIDDVVVVADNINSVNVATSNISSIVTTATNISDVQSVSSNIEAVKSVAATSSLGLLSAINIGNAVVSVSTVIPIETNAFSIGPVTILGEAKITVNGFWKII